MENQYADFLIKKDKIQAIKRTQKKDERQTFAAELTKAIKLRRWKEESLKITLNSSQESRNGVITFSLNFYKNWSNSSVIRDLG